MLENVRNVVAIELITSCQGIEFHAPLRTGKAAQRAYDLVRSVSARVDADRPLSRDIASVSSLIASAGFQILLP